MKRTNKIVNNVNNSFNNMNNNVKRIVDNEIMINIIRVLLILYIAFVIPVLNNKQINHINNNIVRLVIVALIIYLSFMDMVTAVLLTIAFLTTLHHSKNTNVVSNNVVKNNNIVDVEPNAKNIMDLINNKENFYSYDLMNKIKATINDKNIEDEKKRELIFEILEADKIGSSLVEECLGKKKVTDNDITIITPDLFTCFNKGVKDILNKYGTNPGVGNNQGFFPKPGVGANPDPDVFPKPGAFPKLSNKANAPVNLKPPHPVNTPPGEEHFENINNNPPAPLPFDEEDDLNVLNNNSSNEFEGPIINTNIVNANNVANNANNANNVANNGANNGRDMDLQIMNNNHPASKTLTDNILRAKGAETNENDPVGLITGQHLYDASENAVPNADVLDQVKTIKEQHSAQGMDYPMGYKAKRYDGYNYNDNNYNILC